MSKVAAFTLASLLPLASACQDWPACEKEQGLCTWKLITKSLSIGQTSTLSVEITGLKGDKIPAFVKQGDTRLPVTLTRVSSSGPKFEFDLNMTSSTFTGGLAKLTMNEEGSEYFHVLRSDRELTDMDTDAERHELPLSLNEPLSFTEITASYEDKDPDPSGTNSSYQYPIGVSISRNPGASSLSIVSVHRGKEGSKLARKLKIFRLSSDFRTLSLLLPQPDYTLQYEEYVIAPSSESHSWAELSPTWIGFSDRILRSHNYGMGYGPQLRSSGEPFTWENQLAPGLILPSDIKALTAVQHASGGILYTYVESAGSIRMALQPMPGENLRTEDFKPVPNMGNPSGRQWLAFGSLLESDKPTLLSLSLDAGQTFSSVQLFRISSDGSTTEVPGSNLNELLKDLKVGALAVGPLNNDDYADIVYSVGGTIYFLLNQGSGKFVKDPSYSLPDSSTNSAISSLAIGDLNGDMRPDLVVAREFQKKVTVFLNSKKSM